MKEFSKQDCKNCPHYKKKINAPTMAYKTVYGSYPAEPLRGRTNFPKKIWKGLDVDKNLKDKWLEELNNLDVEIKSTDAGKSEERVAFVIFRMPCDKDELYKNVVQELRKENNLHVSADFGLEQRPRICVAQNIVAGQPGWESWWSSLPQKIQRAYRRALNADSESPLK